MEAMPLGENFELWKTGHRAVVVCHFTDDAGRRKAGKPGQIHGCFRVPRTRQDAVWMRAK